MSLSFLLKKSFNGFSIDIALSAAEDLTVLFGPSGAGKTQILKMVSGILRPDEGEVSVEGEPLYDSKKGIDIPVRMRRIGYLFQDYALFPHMTVYENIAYGISHLKKSDVKGKVNELLGVMRLNGLEKRYPRELSGGQRQRTALARTLVTGPRVLLLDEPFSALDNQVREKLRTDLLNIHKMYPITTVIVTHDLEEAFMLGKRIAVINNGRLEQAGTREEVFYRPRTRNVARFIGARNIFTGHIAGLEGGTIIIKNPDLGEVKAIRHSERFFPGQEVTFCIRPEDVIVIRPDKIIEGRVQDNILEGEIISTIGKGSTHILFLKVGMGGELKIELPNFVLRKLGLAIGRHIRVSLKVEDVWVIP